MGFVLLQNTQNCDLGFPIHRADYGISTFGSSSICPTVPLGSLGTYNTLMFTTAAAAAKSLQSCPTLCDPIDSSLPGSPVFGILQARTLEWVAISFSNA